MRMTIFLDDRLGEVIRQRAAENGLGVSALIATTLAHALERPEGRVEKPFRLVTVDGGGVRDGVDLDRLR